MTEARFLFLSQEDVVAAGGLDIAATIHVVEEALRLHAVGDTRLPSKSALMWSDDLGGEETLPKGGGARDRHSAVALGEPDLGLSGSQNSRLQFSQRKT